MNTFLVVIGIGLVIVAFSFTSLWFENTKVGEWLQKVWERNQVTIGIFGFIVCVAGLNQNDDTRFNFIAVGSIAFVIALLNLLGEIAYNTRNKNPQ